MKSKNILITGGYGCIGAEAAKWLLRHADANVVVCSRRVSNERTNRVFHDVDTDRLTVLEADVTSQSTVEKILNEKLIDSIIHLAALQTPECNADRDLGLQINLAGTQNLIEAIKVTGRQLDRFVLASSVAVYGPRSFYPQGRVPMLSAPQPVNVYGVWKLASEHLARIFHEDTGVPTLCLRPGVLYGPGRDAGLTASPTTAMKSLALGIPYKIPFASKQDYLFAPDVGAAFALTVHSEFEGYGVFTLPSHTLTTQQIVQSLESVASNMGLAESFQITVGQGEVPFICDLEFEPFLKAFPEAPHTPLADALRQSMDVFKAQVEMGWLTPESLHV